jgi:hypothetical protein
MKSWNSAFNAHRFETNYIVVVQVGAVKKNYRDVVASGGGAQERWKRGMKLNLPPKLKEKTSLVWVPVISFCKISFQVTHSTMMAYYAAETGRSRPPNRLACLMDNSSK